MLIRNTLQNLYEVDSTLGTTPPPTPDTSQDTKEDKGELETVTMTTKELSRIAAKEAKDAKAKAEKGFLERLGASSEDELKALLTSFREKQEAEKSESQKLLDCIALLEKERDSEKLQREEAVKQARIKERDSELKSLLSKAYEPNQVLILMKATLSAQIDGLLDDSGAFDTALATTLVSDYQKNNPHLFRDTSPGSSFSNRDGKAPQVNEDAKKALTALTAKSLKGF